jgi:excisionase family DNA binding protein
VVAVQRVSIKEAARRLNVSDLTIRRRLNSGELQGVQEPKGKSHIWWVLLPEEETDSQAESPEQDGELQEDTQGEVAALRELVGVLKEQLEIKDKQLETRAREVQELHVLLQQFGTALPAARDNHSWWYKLWHRTVR